MIARSMLCAAVAVSLAFLGCAEPQRQTAAARAPRILAKGGAAPRIPLIGEAAPAFTATTSRGPIKFPDDYKGKWVLIEFWAYW